MKSIKILAVPLIVCSLLAGCTITHKFGPYYGEVVDAETNEPIEGAVVFLRFYTEGYSPAGFIPKYADAVETMTNSNGEFKIPVRRVIVFRAPHRWKPYGYIVIFKPKYGCYPGHEDVSPIFMPNGTLPANEYVTIRLPKLRTIEERKRNLGSINSGATVPDEKKKNLLKLIGIEESEIGL
jgi:hypothetical protein